MSSSSACKYSQSEYWEWTLGKQDVWNDLFVPPEQLSHPVFVNACVVDSGRSLLDNNWACYPGLEPVLGFVQYIFLPTVFYYAMHPEIDRLVVPVLSSEEFLEQIRESDSVHRLAMSGFVYEALSLWNQPEHRQAKALEKFCARFNRYWEQQDSLFCLNLFFSPHTVASYLKEQLWCEELFSEEFGFTYQQLDDLCNRFDEEPFAKHLFLHWLNTRVGCLA